MDVLKSYRDFFDLHIVFDHIISTSPFCFLHKSGGLSVLRAALCPAVKVSPASASSLLSLSFSTSRATLPPLSCQLFFLIVVRLFCDSTLEGETTKGKVSIALPSGNTTEDFFPFFSPFFCAFLFLASSFFLWLFWSRVKELLSHCQMSDSEVAVAWKGIAFSSCVFACLFVRVCMCVRSLWCPPYDSVHWADAGICQLMGDNMQACKC